MTIDEGLAVTRSSVDKVQMQTQNNPLISQNTESTDKGLSNVGDYNRATTAISSLQRFLLKKLQSSLDNLYLEWYYLQTLYIGCVANGAICQNNASIIHRIQNRFSQYNWSSPSCDGGGCYCHTSCDYDDTYDDCDCDDHDDCDCDCDYDNCFMCDCVGCDFV